MQCGDRGARSRNREQRELSFRTSSQIKRVHISFEPFTCLVWHSPQVGRRLGEGCGGARLTRPQTGSVDSKRPQSVPCGNTSLGSFLGSGLTWGTSEHLE